MRHLPLTALRAFEAAARTGSFRAAADLLGVTPSAISHAVRGLEASLRTSLFLREGRGIGLTGPGEALLRHVQLGFAELQRGMNAVSGQERRVLRLHSAPSFAAQWLVPRLPGLLADALGLELRIAASTTYTRFQNDEFDADIVYGRAAVESYARSGNPRIIVLPLGEEILTPLCAPALAAQLRTPHDLVHQTLIESDNKQLRWTDWFAANALAGSPRRGPRFDRSFLSISAAADGLGIALESTRLAERELASGRLVRPFADRAEDLSYIGHWLAFPAAHYHRPELLAFASWLATELGIRLDLPAAHRG